jgi:hypothetical protein
MTWFLLILFAVVLLVILVPVIWLGIAALGTPGDRAAANETLRCAAGFLGGRFRDGANTSGTGARPNTGPSKATWATSGV